MPPKAKKPLGPFGKKLRRAIAGAGWTRARLLRELGMEGTTLHRYETGVRSPPLEVVQRIAAALEIDAAELVSLTPTTTDDAQDDDLSRGWRDFVEKGYVQFFQLRGATPEMIDRVRSRRFKGVPSWRDYVVAMEDELGGVEGVVPQAILDARRRNAELGRPPSTGLVKPPKKDR